MITMHTGTTTAALRSLVSAYAIKNLSRSKMLQTLIRRSAAAVKFDINKNPYKAKRQWPPDFDQLSQKHQFRLERRYRRRAKLAWARPRWTKFVKLATWGSIACMSCKMKFKSSVKLTHYQSL